MGNKVQKEKKQKYHKCKECGLVYSEKEMAEKCQKWCSEHKSCNIDIIKYAVEPTK